MESVRVANFHENTLHFPLPFSLFLASRRACSPFHHGLFTIHSALSPKARLGLGAHTLAMPGKGTNGQRPNFSVRLGADLAEERLARTTCLDRAGIFTLVKRIVIRIVIGMRHLHNRRSKVSIGGVVVAHRHLSPAVAGSKLAGCSTDQC